MLNSISANSLHMWLCSLLLPFAVDGLCQYMQVGMPSLAVGPDHIYMDIPLCEYVFAHMVVTRQASFLSLSLSLIRFVSLLPMNGLEIQSVGRYAQPGRGTRPFLCIYIYIYILYIGVATSLRLSCSCDKIRFSLYLSPSSPFASFLGLQI